MDEREFEAEIKKKFMEAMESQAGAKKFVEETIKELTKDLKEAKSEEDIRLIERKISVLEDIVDELPGGGYGEDAEEVKEILGAVSEHLPKIMDSIFGPIKDLLNEVYDPEKAEKLGKNVAHFYKELVEAGMDPDKAFELTKEYMDSVNVIKSIISAVMQSKMADIKNLEKLGKAMGGMKKHVEIEEEFEEEL